MSGQEMAKIRRGNLESVIKIVILLVDSESGTYFSINLMGRSISDETCDQQMIFAISLRHDNQQCVDKIIDFTCHHLMTKPCRNVCGAQQLMKPAFSAPLMIFLQPISSRLYSRLIVA
jgi:hypothetical protein